MRPRVFPAEDRPHPGPIRVTVRAASMRPRVFPAEDLEIVVAPPLLPALQ